MNGLELDPRYAEVIRQFESIYHVPGLVGSVMEQYAHLDPEGLLNVYYSPMTPDEYAYSYLHPASTDLLALGTLLAQHGDVYLPTIGTTARQFGEAIISSVLPEIGMASIPVAPAVQTTVTSPESSQIASQPTITTEPVPSVPFNMKAPDVVVFPQDQLLQLQAELMNRYLQNLTAQENTAMQMISNIYNSMANLQQTAQQAAMEQLNLARQYQSAVMPYIQTGAEQLQQFLSAPVGQGPLTTAATEAWERLVRPVIEQSLAAQGFFPPSGAYTEALTRARSEMAVPLIQQDIENRLKAAQALANIGTTLGGLQAGIYSDLTRMFPTIYQTGLTAAGQLASLGDVAAQRYRQDLLTALTLMQQQRSLQQQAEEAAWQERQRILSALTPLYYGWAQNVPMGQTQSQSVSSGWGFGK